MTECKKVCSLRAREKGGYPLKFLTHTWKHIQLKTFLLPSLMSNIKSYFIAIDTYMYIAFPITIIIIKLTNSHSGCIQMYATVYPACVYVHVYVQCTCICSDTICDLGGGDELANYGEYSGAPSESQTFEYAKTVLGLMTKKKLPDGRRSSS